ncbi:hypothetical protein GCM10007304_41680 [Rhodococcoides trifolii]|uniref:Uncharacterized protein n=1 Tax=Rhodococcoides trifolii TaxID=908250 RepID=A0A917G610_9NOCA|nr:hypothetical protein [Rhodococcus trifolii]GGG23484.1 hypothetical protein GCM10007304_41680 [Rhodococcus trifolii]
MAPTSVPAGTTSSFPAPPTEPDSRDDAPTLMESLTVSPSAPTRSAPTVNAEIYDAHHPGDDETYFFRTPTGRTTCGFRLGLAEFGYRVGCQTSSVPSTPGVPTCGHGGPGVHINAEGTSRLCAKQNVYGGATIDYGPVAADSMPTLEYGDTIEVDGASCTSAETGVTCFDAGHAFRLSVDESVIYS